MNKSKPIWNAKKLKKTSKHTSKKHQKKTMFFIPPKAEHIEKTSIITSIFFQKIGVTIAMHFNDYINIATMSASIFLHLRWMWRIGSFKA